jgi:hypothetical protein
MKLLNNMLGQIQTVAIAEALVYGVKAGLDPHKIYEVIRVSTGSSVQFENRVPRMLKRDFTPGGTIDISYKGDYPVLDYLALAFIILLAFGGTALASGRLGKAVKNVGRCETHFHVDGSSTFFAVDKGRSILSMDIIANLCAPLPLENVAITNFSEDINSNLCVGFFQGFDSYRVQNTDSVIRMLLDSGEDRTFGVPPNGMFLGLIDFYSVRQRQRSNESRAVRSKVPSWRLAGIFKTDSEFYTFGQAELLYARRRIDIRAQLPFSGLVGAGDQAARGEIEEQSRASQNERQNSQNNCRGGSDGVRLPVNLNQPVDGPRQQSVTHPFPTAAVIAGLIVAGFITALLLGIVGIVAWREKRHFPTHNKRKQD